MNTYTAIVAELRELRAAWRRSDDAYREQPIVSCGAWQVVGGVQFPCSNIAHPRDVLCRGCRRKVAAQNRRA